MGGTWVLNDYPEARVDISNFVYQFKFEKNYPWRSYFASQPEIRAYLEHIATKYGIREHIRFNTAVTDAVWDEAAQRWSLRLTTGGGSESALSTRILFSASGLFSTAKLPDIEGIERFGGAMFHTTMWDHSVPIAGKRVALIGTGSSGAQLMPHLARAAETLSVFQRTPNWVAPVEGYQAPVTKAQHWLMRHMPNYWSWFCYAFSILDRQLEPLQEYDLEWQQRGGLVNERNDKFRAFLEQSLRSRFAGRPDLLAKSLPAYPPAARRLVVDNGWFDALLRPNVELLTDPIARITPGGIVTADGTERPFDLIVLGSGFQTSRYLWPVRYHGRGGVTPEALWAKDGARSYLGMTMPGFPNFFMFYGPNGQPRGGGFHAWAELWAGYATQVIMAMVERGAGSAEVRAQVYDAYNARMDSAMGRLIWGGEGSGSYYLNEHGRSGVNMPWRAEAYYRWIAEPAMADFELR